MFLCCKCRDASGLHERLARSAGQCEVCMVYTMCDDWPSSQMPEGTKLVSGRTPPEPELSPAEVQFYMDLKDIITDALEKVNGSRISWDANLVGDTIDAILDVQYKFMENVIAEAAN